METIDDIRTDEPVARIVFLAGPGRFWLKRELMKQSNICFARRTKLFGSNVLVIFKTDSNERERYISYSSAVTSSQTRTMTICLPWTIPIWGMNRGVNRL
ncbi:hypothetical protein H7Y29_00230 [Microbacteriaceae bacterium]|nr:hypothetical protein [Candidatus Saccharibacteria bacterium]